MSVIRRRVIAPVVIVACILMALASTSLRATPPTERLPLRLLSEPQSVVLAVPDEAELVKRALRDAARASSLRRRLTALAVNRYLRVLDLIHRFLVAQQQLALARLVALRRPMVVKITGPGFESCVISRESGGNPTEWNPSGAGTRWGHWGLFQFARSTWIAHGGNPADWGNPATSVAEQEQVFENTVAADGTSDWRPYDHC